MSINQFEIDYNTSNKELESYKDDYNNDLQN